MNEPLPATLLAAVAAVTDWLLSTSIPGVIVGGVAASLLGRPRLTRDVDALVDLSDDRWSDALAAAANFHLEPRIDDALGFARRSRVLLLRHSPSQIDVDVILSGLPFERDAIASGVSRPVGGIAIRLPRVEDLMIMKAIAHRPRDLMDLEGLLRTSPGADLERVRRWVREFSIAATLPELIDDLDRLIARTRDGP